MDGTNFITFWISANGLPKQWHQNINQIYKQILLINRLITLYSRPSWELRIHLLICGKQTHLVLQELRQSRAELLKLLEIRLKSDRNGCGQDLDTFGFSQLPHSSRLYQYQPSRWISLGITTFKYATIGIISWQAVRHMPWPRLWRECCRLSADVSTFIGTWIYEPLLSIWKTIRYRENKLQLLSSAEIWQQDLSSLNGMIVEYCNDVNQDSNSFAEPLTIILQDYERALRLPIKNLFFGHLLRLLLIQVQKSKVDLERAMLALDQLLRSNELSFELMAILPLAGISIYSISWMRHAYWNRFTNMPYQKMARELCKLLRSLERYIDQPKPSAACGLSCDPELFVRFGELFEQIQLIKRKGIVSAEKFIEMMDDLRMLSTGSDDSQAYFNAIRRMKEVVTGQI